MWSRRPSGVVRSNRPEERPHRFPGQRPWELLAAIDAGRVDLCVEPGRDLASGRQEPEEGTEVGHHMLEGRTRQAGADGAQKGVEIPAVERGEPRRVRFVADVCQKLPGGAAVVRQGRRRDPPDLLQIGPVGGDSLLGPGQRGRRIQRQLGLAIPRHLPDQHRQIGILLGIGGSTGPQSRPRQARQGLHAALLQTTDESRRRTKMLAGAFSRVALLQEPSAVSVQDRTDDRQRRVPPVHLGIQINQHRDLREGGAGIGTVPMLRT